MTAKHSGENSLKRGVLPKIAVITALIGAVVLIAFVAAPDNKIKNTDLGGNFPYPEIKEIQENKIESFTDLTKYFTALANKKGGEYAFRVLGAAPIPPNTDMHLLGHTVGDVLYKQQGINGIKVCTPDFRNACSHSIVVGLLLEKGEGVLPEIAETCKKAPGGIGAYTMCFHGLGHGVLAYSGYDLPKAIELCRKTGTAQYGDREAIECIGGTVMEIISGGFHNKELWEIQSKKYLPAGDPLYPCNSGFMPENARSQCYDYLTPHLFTAVGGDIGSPTPEDFKKAFPLCEKILEPWNRQSCYGGFGKEFVVLGKNRDVRRIDQMSVEEMSRVIGWCGLANNSEGTRSCLRSAESSLYWGGENDRSAVIKFCSLTEPGFLQDGCYADIIGFVSFYITDIKYRTDFCTEIPAQHGEKCRIILLNQ